MRKKKSPIQLEETVDGIPAAKHKAIWKAGAMAGMSLAFGIIEKSVADQIKVLGIKTRLPK